VHVGNNGGMRSPSPLPEPFSDSAFAVKVALEQGITSQRLRAADLEVPARGARFPGGNPTLRDRCAAHVAVVPDAVVSHSTAAMLWELHLPLSLKRSLMIHLTRQPPHRAVRRTDIVGHVLTLHPEDVVDGKHFAATSPLRTWYDLASLLPLDDLVYVGDQLVRRRNPYSTIEQMTALLERMTGQPGVARARRAMEWVRSNTDSAKETELRLALVRAGLPEPEINAGIFYEHGLHVETPDMMYREYKIVLQYDGGHHITEEQRRYDIGRDEDAQDLGWRVLKFTQMDLDIRDSSGLQRAVVRVENALRERGWRP
jgi:hypothetical protein